MSGEEAQAVQAGHDVLGDGPRETESVEGGRTPTQLVYKDKKKIRGVSTGVVRTGTSVGPVQGQCRASAGVVRTDFSTGGSVIFQSEGQLRP